MTGHEYRHAIEHLQMTQVGSAKFFGVADSTTRRWIADKHPIPPAVAMLLWVMVKRRLSPGHVEAIQRRAERVAP
jgi:hypothetical protein